MAIGRRQHSLQDFLLAFRADAARDALAARLIAEEARDAQQDAFHVGGVVEHDHSARTQRCADGSRALEAERNVKLRGGDEGARRSAEQDCLQRPPRPHAAGVSVQELTQGRAHRDLVEARLEDLSRHAEQTSAGRVLRAGRGERSAAFGDDVEHVDQRLHVVFERRLPEQADLEGERRLVSRLSPLPLDGVEERGLLAANVGAGTTPHLDVDAEQASVAGLCDRVLDPFPRQRILGPHVNESFSTPGRECRDGHALDQCERVALQQDAVFERSRLRLVRVADQVVRANWRVCDRLPLATGRKRGAAATEKPGLGDLADHRRSAHLLGPPQGRETAVAEIAVDAERIDDPHPPQKRPSPPRG